MSSLIVRVASLGQAIENVRRKQRILSSLFALQRAMVLDEERFLCARPGRRAGKTWAVMAFLLCAAVTAPEGAMCPYISTSRKHAKRNTWAMLHRMNRQLELGLVFNATELTASFEGAGSVWISGCADEAQMEEFTGDPYPAVAIDEAGSFPLYLEELVNRVLLPALADYQGRLILTGTPPPSPVGLFHRVVAEESVAGWGKPHHWTMVDNPHIPHAAEEMRIIREKRGWSEDHPTYRREYLGECVSDAGLLVYAYHDGVSIEELPRDEYRYVLGIDFGWSETRTTTAFSLIAYSTTKPVTIVVRTWAMTAQPEASIAAEIHRVDSEVGGLEAIVGDPGGFGRKFIDELMVRHQLPIVPAEKQDKRGYIQLLNSDMRTGRLRVVRTACQGLIGEWLVLPWKDETRKEERAGVPNHHSDATLYAWRRCLHFAFRPTEPQRFTPQIDDAEFQKQEEQRIVEGLEKQFREERETPWWKRGRRGAQQRGGLRLSRSRS